MEAVEKIDVGTLTVECFDSAPTGWDNYVSEHPKSKIYHQSKWNEMIEKTFGHKTAYYVLKRDNAICGVLPLVRFKSFLFGKFAVSLPFINYGGPLLSNSDDAPALVSALKSFREDYDMKFVELRLDEEMPLELPCKQHKVTFFLDLPADEEALMAGFKAKLRSQIRRPGKAEMYAKSGGEDLLDDFYHVFTVNMRDLGTPPLPKAFFRNILQTFPDNASISAVYSKEDQIAAASFLIGFRDTMEIPWASALRDFNKFSPNMLLYWESLRYSVEKGYKRFDYGRCTPDTGTYKFKKQWGAVESPLFWYYVMPAGEEMPEMNHSNSKFDMVIKTWQKLPLGLTKILGPKIIKHIP
ncbi:MAG: FemAB family XrtA/PEP-CTERM system-associated protein [Calditrichia bacterium]